MNIFDNLVNELKEEHLLEETVIDDENLINEPKEDQLLEETVFDDGDKTTDFEEPENNSLKGETPDEDEKVSLEPRATLKEPSENSVSPTQQSKNKKEITDRERKNKFFRKRATKEVSFLQMVELVLSGVEREQLKVVPRPYDDLKVKKVLHEYLQASRENDLHKQANFEFQLLQETQSWYSALSHRDKRVSAAHLRRFCETTRPALSAPALISIARFYRNAPFSEPVRNKFDLIITRVFSKDLDGERRELVFTREELKDHTTGLYSEWESVPMYSTNQEDPEILNLEIKFEEFMREAVRAETFDDLVNSDFFNRLRSFKKSTNENFYSPSVTAAAVECNIKVGNCYVDLIELERQKTSSKLMDEKYGLIIDQVVSDVTSKTLQLVDLLDKKGEASKRKTNGSGAETVQRKFQDSGIFKSFKNLGKSGGLFKINKWLLALAGLTIVFTLGLYGWVEFSESGPKRPSTVQQLNLGDSGLDLFVIVPRLSNGVFYGVVTENWKGLSKEEKENILRKARAFGKENGVSKVHLLNKEGITEGTADEERVFVRKVK